jgi:opacity protein-like surface antigen
VNTSVTGNVNKWFGFTADYSGHFGTEPEGILLVSKNAHTFQVGPRISRRGKRFTPFVYALFGATRFKQSATVNGVHLSESDTGFASTFGGGLDVTVNDRVAIRAFQIDYFRPNFFGEAHNRGRLAFGLVLRFGKK